MKMHTRLLDVRLGFLYKIIAILVFLSALRTSVVKKHSGKTLMKTCLVLHKSKKAYL